MRPHITLSDLNPAGRDTISRWPPYKAPYEELDYALRAPGGWLYTFGAKPECVKYGAYVEGALVGFCLLLPDPTSKKEAEFYVAIHPDEVNKGYGKAVTMETLRRGFEDLRLRRIFLKVRKNHTVGIRLYEGIGFTKFDECTEEVNGKQTEFYKMQIADSDFSGIYGRQSV
jgi:RimJ/RimL family protein N-acetyltransferase